MTKAKKEQMEKILGKKLAVRVMQQLEEPLEERMRRVKRHR